MNNTPFTTMTTRLKIVIFSHLSDMEYSDKRLIHNRSNFIKWLINKYPNINVDIDAEVEWDEFVKTRFYQTVEKWDELV